MADINWTRESEIWLRDIYNYIASDDPDAAARTLTRIYDSYELETSREVRILLYEHYRITYVIKADGNIDILGVFHGALDIDHYFI